MKRALDLAITLPLLLLSTPVLVLLCLGVLLTSGRPVFHHATRVGRDGRIFTMLKLRTMRLVDGPAITAGDDVRVTPLGRVLRRHHLDELPQLWNVMRGDMSLVGPRPEDPKIVRLYAPEQRVVLSVRPGMTGPAQLTFRDEAGLLDPKDPEGSYVRDVLPRKLAIDIEYARRHGMLRDLELLGRTVGAVLRRT